MNGGLDRERTRARQRDRERDGKRLQRGRKRRIGGTDSDYGKERNPIKSEEIENGREIQMASAQVGKGYLQRYRVPLPPPPLSPFARRATILRLLGRFIHGSE